jgi:cation transport ATPase
VLQAAGDVADVVLLRDSPAQVAEAFWLARATLRKIRQNLVWAFGYNLVAVPVAAGALLPPFGVMLTPFLSAALMATSSLAVMANSLLLRRAAGRRSLGVGPAESAAFLEDGTRRAGDEEVLVPPV